MTISLFTGCCWTDHTDTIKEVAEPMLKELDAFYKKNKRFPNNKERDEMLVSSGCSKVKNEKCSYGWKSLQVKLNNRGYNYSMTLKYDHSYCRFGLFDDGKLMPSSCDKKSCISTHQQEK